MKYKIAVIARNRREFRQWCYIKYKSIKEAEEDCTYVRGIQDIYNRFFRDVICVGNYECINNWYGLFKEAESRVVVFKEE
jgi:hypothetical protein